MTVRCIVCNKINSFRNYRGNKLSEHRCDCGGKLQMVGGHRVIAGHHPFNDEETCYKSDYYETPYYSAEANKKGEIFVRHDGYFHQIAEFVLAKNKTNPESVKCPECLQPVSKDELDTFGGLCEECGSGQASTIGEDEV